MHHVWSIFIAGGRSSYRHLWAEYQQHRRHLKSQISYAMVVSVARAGIMSGLAIHDENLSPPEAEMLMARLLRGSWNCCPVVIFYRRGIAPAFICQQAVGVVAVSVHSWSTTSMKALAVCQSSPITCLNGHWYVSCRGDWVFLDENQRNNHDAPASAAT